MPKARELIEKLERACALAKGAQEELEFGEPDELVALKPFRFYVGQEVGLIECLTELKEMEHAGAFDADALGMRILERRDDASRAAFSRACTR